MLLVASWGAIGLQDSCAPLMEQLSFFMDYAMIVVVSVTAVVGYFTFTLIFNTFVDRLFMENQSLEILWTTTPVVVVGAIALPSVELLYALEEVKTPTFTVKVIGSQWYWNYEYPDFNVAYDSYMSKGDGSLFRLLEVDSRLVVPVDTSVRVLITATDVIHSWAVPSLGVKVDAIPGRMNQSEFNVLYVGLFYGQCSEICGANHSFMPITVESVNAESFVEYINSLS